MTQHAAANSERRATRARHAPVHRQRKFSAVCVRARAGESGSTLLVVESAAAAPGSARLRARCVPPHLGHYVRAELHLDAAARARVSLCVTN